jgi:nitroreductase
MSYDEIVLEQRRPALVADNGAIDMHELVRLGTLAASSHNTQPWRFLLGPREITILPDFARRCPVVDPDDAHLFKSLGCAAENIVHAAAARSHAAHVAFDTDARCIRITLEPSAASGRTATLHEAIPKRQCTKRPYDGRPIAGEHVALLEASGAGDGVRTLLIEDATTRDAIIALVRRGDMQQLTDPAFRKEFFAWLRYNDNEAIAAGDGLASRTAGQPSLPSWLARPMAQLILRGSAQARTDERNIRTSPMLVAFATASDTPEAWVEIGRVYERFALQATALGIRTAFINQPIEVATLQPELARVLRLDGEKPLLLIRAGYGPQAPFSMRRPVEEVIEHAV